MFRPIKVANTRSYINKVVNTGSYFNKVANTRIPNNKFIIRKNFSDNLLIAPVPIDKFSELKNYLNNLYKYSNIGITGTLATSLTYGYMGHIIMQVFDSASILPITMLWTLNLGAHVYTYTKLTNLPYNYITRYSSQPTEIVTKEKHDWFTLYWMTAGINYAPIIALSLNIYPMIIPTVIATIMGSYIGASKFALSKCKSIKDIKKYTPVIGTITGIISAILVHSSASYMGFINFGNLSNISTMALTSIACYAFLTHDYMRAIEDYTNNKFDSVRASIKYI